MISDFEESKLELQGLQLRALKRKLANIREQLVAKTALMKETPWVIPKDSNWSYINDEKDDY